MAVVPIVVLANKMERPEALLEADVERALNVQQLRTGKGNDDGNFVIFELDENVTMFL